MSHLQETCYKITQSTYNYQATPPPNPPWSLPELLNRVQTLRDTFSQTSWRTQRREVIATHTKKNLFALKLSTHTHIRSNCTKTITLKHKNQLIWGQSHCFSICPPYTK